MSLRTARRALGFAASPLFLLACGGRAELGLGAGGSSGGGAPSWGGFSSSGASSSGGFSSSGASSSGGPVTGNDCPTGGVDDGDPCVDNGPDCSTPPVVDCTGNEYTRPCTCVNSAWACAQDNPPVCLPLPSPQCPYSLSSVASGLPCDPSLTMLCPGAGTTSCGFLPIYECVNGEWQQQATTIQCHPEDAGPGGPPPVVDAGGPAPMGCGLTTVSFDWGTSMAGRCSAVIDPQSVDLTAGLGWVFTNETDAYVGGFFAQCTGGAWVISQEKCAARGDATTCFPPGTPCDGSGPAIFPYEHCWTCCDSTPAVPGVCN